MSNQKDITEKMLLSWNDVFADVVNGFLCNGNPVVKQDDLADSAPTSQFKANAKIHEQERDVAKFWSKSGTRIAVLGIENQTKPDADMVMRVISYDGASYKEQVLQHEAAKRDQTGTIQAFPAYPAITMVINYGKTPWNQPKSLLALIGEENIPENIRPYVNDYKIHVFDIVSLEKHELDMFKSDFQHIAKFLWAEHHKEEYVPSDANLVHADETIKLLSALTKTNDILEAYNNISQHEGGEVTMCRIVNEIEARSEIRGVKLAADVFRTYKETNSVSETAKAHELSEERVKEILKNFEGLLSN